MLDFHEQYLPDILQSFPIEFDCNAYEFDSVAVEID